MKKSLSIIVAILMSISVFAQTRTTFVKEHFDGSSLPDGWQIIGNGTSNWSISSSQNAGGQANELHLAWSPQFNGTSRVVTPAVDLTGVSSVLVSFRHFLDYYQGSHTLGIATSSDNGTTWNVGWQQTYSSNVSATVVTQEITTADMGNSNVMFCLFYTGNSYNINDWYFDDIEIFSQENLDLSISSIDMSSVMGAGSKTIACTVKNIGATSVNQVKLSYQFEGFEAVEETFNVSLATFASTQLTFAEPTTFVPGTYTVTVNIETVNGVSDDDSANNSRTRTIGVALGQTQRIPMIEHFSSSTCGPCVSWNTAMLNLTNNNPGKFTYTKYQMNWPGSGDPYYTAEGGTRRQYYGISAVPSLFLEGAQQNTVISQATLNNHYNEPAFADVRGSFNIDGNTINVKVDFMSFVEFSGAKAFVSVNEKVTTGNVGSNGETSFHHVFMKFLTAAAGNAINIPAGEYEHFEFTQDLSSTHVEEMNDLEVAAWIQVYGSKEILNSRFLYEYTDVHPYPVQNFTFTNEGETLRAAWEAPEGGNAISYNVYVNSELVENTTALEYTIPAEENFYAVAIQAVYPNDMTSVSLVKVLDLQPATTLTLSTTSIAFENPDDTHILTITNNTAGAVTIEEIAEENTEYLNVEFNETLPYVLEQGSSMNVTISPLTSDRALVTTKVNIVSSVGIQSVNVTVDDSWLNIDENTANFEIYPNPTNDKFVVKGDNINEVEVYNLCGQKVLSVKTDSQNVNVNMSDFATGVYMVKITDNNGSSTVKKVVKR